MRLFRIGVALLVLAASHLSLAQQVNIGNSRVGTIQSIAYEESVITISGQAYDFRLDNLGVFFDGAEVDFSILSQGIVVRFYRDSEGQVIRMELLGPIDRIREFFES